MKKLIKKLESFHKRNDGSTMIVVLTVVAFLSILSVVVTSAAMLNYKMKVVSGQSEKAFYTSEEAVDEVYVALGKASMESFDAAYNDEISTVVRQTTESGMTYTYTLSDDTINSNLRVNFTYKLLTKLNLLAVGINDDKHNSTTFTSKAYNGEGTMKEFVTMLNNYINGVGTDLSTVPLKIVSVDNIYITQKPSTIEGKEGILTNYELNFTNCHVQYKDEKAYFADITFNGKIAMPDIFVNFVENTYNDENSFMDFVLIGNKGVILDNNKKLILNGHVYAGKGDNTGLTLKAGSTMSAGSYRIISGGCINVKGATLNAAGAELWCDSFVTMRDVDNSDVSSTVNVTGDDSYVFAKDDLQIDGDRDNVNIGGSYYGYSYQGMNTSEGNHTNSSAIIVNGQNALLNISSMRTLLLGGRAYIDYNNGQKAYTTGESLAFKGSQEIYLVPSNLMSRANPVMSASESETVTVNLTEENFFGYKFLSDTGSKYVTRTIPIKDAEGNIKKYATYYYLKFKSDDDSAKYVDALMSSKNFEEGDTDKINLGTDLYYNFSAAPANLKQIISNYNSTKAYVRALVELNVAELGSYVQVSNESNMFSNGRMLAATNDGAKLVASEDRYVVDTKDGFLLNAQDLSNRYDLMNRILEAPEFMNGSVRNYITSLGSSVTINGKKIDISGYKTNQVFNNFIDTEELNKLIQNPIGIGKGSKEANKPYKVKIDDKVILISNANIYVGDMKADEAGLEFTENKGLIVTTGNVYVRKDFTGTIFANKIIYVDKDATVTSDSEVSNTFFSDAEVFNDIKATFRRGVTEDITETEGNETELTEDELNITNMTYKNFVDFSSWRRINDYE